MFRQNIFEPIIILHDLLPGLLQIQCVSDESAQFHMPWISQLFHLLEGVRLKQLLEQTTKFYINGYIRYFSRFLMLAWFQQRSLEAILW